jgi:hypothetical protein
LMFALCSSFTSMLKSQAWRHTWWQTMVLCNFQCSHSDATWHTEWRRSLLANTAPAFTYCHRLVFYGTSLKTFLIHLHMWKIICSNINYRESKQTACFRTPDIGFYICTWKLILQIINWWEQFKNTKVFFCSSLPYKAWDTVK